MVAQSKQSFYQVFSAGIALLLAVYFAADLLDPATGLGILVLPVWLFAPGFCIVRFFFSQKDESLAYRICLSFVISPVVAVLYFMVSVWALQLTLALSCRIFLGAVLIANLILCFKGKAVAYSTNENKEDLRTLIFLLAIIVPLQIVSFWIDPNNRLSVHGIFHGAHVSLISSNMIPPFNPFLAEFSARIYWLYHLYLAALSQTAHTSYVNVQALLQHCLLISYTFFGYCCLKFFTSPLRAMFYSVFACFAANFYGSLLVLFQVAVTGFDLNGYTLSNYLNTYGHNIAHVMSAGVFVKFLSFNGFTFGLTFFMLTLLGYLRRDYAIALIGLLGVCAFHPTSALGTVMAIPGGFFLAQLISDRFKSQAGRRQLLLMAGTPALAIIVFLPYFFTFAFSGYDHTLVLGFSPWSVKQYSLAYAPLLFLAALSLIWLKKPEPNQIAITFMALFLLILLLFATLPYNNQYKFILLSSVPLALLSLMTIKRLGGILGDWAPNTLITVFVAVSLLSILTMQTCWSFFPNWMQVRKIAITGSAFELTDSPSENKAYAWISANTPHDAVFIENCNYCEKSYMGVLGGRQSYFVPCYLFVDTPRALKRKDVVKGAFLGNESLKARLNFAKKELGGPVYLFLSARQNRKNYHDLLKTYSMQKELSKVFEDKSVAIFKIN